MKNSKKVLIIDDDLGIRESLRELLEYAGYEVMEAGDGKMAIDLLETSPSLPSMILLDLMMPALNGYAFREIQQNNPKISQIPIVLMTAGTDIEIKGQSLEAMAYLRKPFDIDTILNLLEEHFSAY